MPWADANPDRRRGYHVGNLRSLLLEEARAIVGESGVGQLNLRALAARAGIAPGSVYHHYASKTALMAGLAGEGFAQLEAALRAAAGSQTPIRACALAYFGFAQAEPGLYSLMFDPPVLNEPSVAAARDQAFAVLEQVIGEAPSQHDRPPELVHKVALAVWACGHGAASMTLAQSSDVNSPLMEDVIQGLEALFRRR